jgi:prepilin-type N-terminal cleavage/methylation domain-containing protein
MKQVRLAFSLIELLVVVSIIGVLVALLLPAVQYAREAARRAECKNHLHQVGVALESYHSSHNVLPFGWMCSANDLSCLLNQPHSHMWSGLAMILPELEQATIFNSLNFSLPRNHVSNRTGLGQAIEVFLCPSHSRSSRVPDHLPLGNGFLVGASDYKANAGGGSRMQSGLMFRNSNIRFGDIFDGDSNTIMVGESSARDSDGRWADASQCCIHTLDRINAGPAYWSSSHSRGMHFVLADGSVRFVSESVRTDVLIALATRDGRETVDGGDF